MLNFIISFELTHSRLCFKDFKHYGKEVFDNLVIQILYFLKLMRVYPFSIQVSSIIMPVDLCRLINFNSLTIITLTVIKLIITNFSSWTLHIKL